MYGNRGIEKISKILVIVVVGDGYLCKFKNFYSKSFKTRDLLEIMS